MNHEAQISGRGHRVEVAADRGTPDEPAQPPAEPADDGASGGTTVTTTVETPEPQPAPPAEDDGS